MKVNVRESASENSCSVEESNRIRAQLGLKPLQIETREDREEIQRHKVFSTTL